MALHNELNTVEIGSEPKDSVLNLLEKWEQRDLKEADLISEVNISLLAQHPKHVRSLAYGLLVLNNAEFLTDENRKLLSQYPEHAHGLAQVLGLLKQASLLDEETQTALIQHIQYASGIADVLNRLLNWVKVGVTKDDYMLLINQAQFAQNIDQGLMTIRKEEDLATKKNCMLLIQHAQYADGIANALIQLKKAKLLTPQTQEEKNYALLIKQPKYAGTIASCLGSLRSSGIATQENFEFIAQHARDAHFLVEAMAILNQSRLLTPENRQALLAKAQDFNCAYGMPFGICTLSRSGILTPENRAHLVQHAKYASEIANGFFELKLNRLDSPENCKTLVKYRDFISEISSALRRAPVMADYQATFDGIIQNIDTRIKQERFAILSAGIPRTDGPMGLFFQSHICDRKNLPKEILDFLPQPR